MEFVAKFSYLIFSLKNALTMNFDVWTGRASGENIITTA